MTGPTRSMVNTPFAVRVSHLVQGYGKVEVLHDVSVDVREGEILALIGPSGAGKTTLISTIMGMRRPRAGTVEALGTAMPNRAELGHIGFMGQTDALYESLSGRENLAFFGALQRMSGHPLKREVLRVARIVHLENALDRGVRDYSGGMKRRLSLAIALIGDPRLLMLDEPTVGIDPELRIQIWNDLHRLAEEGHAIIFTTHVMADAAEADTLMMIRDGGIIAEGSPSQIRARYHATNLEQAFVQAGKDHDAHTGND